MKRTKLWYFERLGFLQGLSAKQQQRLAEQTRMVQIRRGQAVYLPGDPSEHLYLLKAGAVKIIGRSPEGEEVILAMLAPGDIFGEVALFDGQPQDHRAEAAADTLLCLMPRSLLIQMMHEAPEFALRITKLIGLRLRTLRTRVEDLLGKSAPARLAHTLLELSRQYGVSDREGILIPLRLSQGDLGRLVGLTRETVNGILHVWREAGLVEMDRRSIRLRDPERLKSVS